jgi:hypothetical protein
MSIVIVWFATKYYPELLKWILDSTQKLLIKGVDLFAKIMEKRYATVESNADTK